MLIHTGLRVRCMHSRPWILPYHQQCMPFLLINDNVCWTVPLGNVLCVAGRVRVRGGMQEYLVMMLEGGDGYDGDVNAEPTSYNRSI
jgi:hypothetical protein